MKDKGSEGDWYDIYSTVYSIGSRENTSRKSSYHLIPRESTLRNPKRSYCKIRPLYLVNRYQRRGPLWFCFGELRWLSFINDEFVAGLQGQTSLMIQKILRKITCLRSWMYCSILLASSGKKDEKDEKAKIKQKFYWLSAKGYHCLPFAGHVVYSIHLVTVAERGIRG